MNKNLVISFNGFLQEKQVEQSEGLSKDILIEQYNDWLVELDVDYFIKWADEFVEKKLKEQKQEFKHVIEEKITNFENGKSKMCWICSYWGKDCKCKHNEILKNILKTIEKT